MLRLTPQNPTLALCKTLTLTIHSFISLKALFVNTEIKKTEDCFLQGEAPAVTASVGLNFCVRLGVTKRVEAWFRLGSPLGFSATSYDFCTG